MANKAMQFLGGIGKFLTAPFEEGNPETIVAPDPQSQALRGEVPQEPVEQPPPPQQTSFPRNETKPEGGTTYAIDPNQTDRVSSYQVVKQSGGMFPKDDGKPYPKDINDPTFQKAPSIEEAFNIDQKPHGLGGWAAKIGTELASTLGSVIGGGLAGGRQGAGQGLLQASKERAERMATIQKQAAEVGSNKTLREAYEIARKNYEIAYNDGKTDPNKPFGDFLAEALDLVGTRYSGTLGMLQQAFGVEEGTRRWEEQQRAIIGARFAPTTSVSYLDPKTGLPVSKVSRTAQVPSAPAGAEPPTSTSIDASTGQVKQTRKGARTVGDYLNQ